MADSTGEEIILSVSKTTLFETKFRNMLPYTIGDRIDDSSTEFFMLFPSNKKKIKKMTFHLFWLVGLIANVCVLDLQAQSNKSDKVIFDTCETGKAKLADSGFDFLKNAKPDSYLVIIGGAMKGEKSSYNSRRIQESIGYLDFVGPIKSDRIVFGTGMPETEAGYLRLYVNGILGAEIRTRKNARLCWGDGGVFDFKRKD